MTPETQVTRLAPVAVAPSPLKSSGVNSSAFATTPEAVNSRLAFVGGGVGLSVNEGAFSPFSAGRKRQLNIRSFLADILPPDSATAPAILFGFFLFFLSFKKIIVFAN